MIVQIRIELDDTARLKIASLIAGKDVKRLASRQDVTGMVTGVVDAIKGASASADGNDRPNGHAPDILHTRRNGLKLNEPDPEDAQRLAGAEPNYIVGWNKFKYRLGASA